MSNPPCCPCRVCNELPKTAWLRDEFLVWCDNPPLSDEHADCSESGKSPTEAIARWNAKMQTKEPTP